MASSPLLCSSPVWTVAPFQLNSSCFRLPYRTDLVGPIAFLTTPRHGPSRKHRFQQYLYCCMSIRWCGKVFTEPLHKNGCSTFAYLSVVASNGYTLYNNLSHCKANVSLFANGRSHAHPIRGPLIRMRALIVGVSQTGLHLLLMSVLCWPLVKHM
jgi:hypothetical protein